MVVVRAAQIGWVTLGLALFALAEYLRPGRKSANALPHRLRLALERLGPTFIKLGQTLSQRSDILPPIWLAELRQLQEGTGGFAPELAAKQIEAAFGKSINDLFADFQLEPIAAASVAQVHRARLKDGSEVIVKVLRPGVRRSIDQDMKILLVLVWLAACVSPRLARRQPTMLIRQIRLNLRKETDLREEASNIRRFAFAFQDSNSVHIPNTLAGLVAETVLVQELSHGRHLDDDDLVRTDGPRLALVFIDAYLTQFFKIGFFHADPHPGNLFAMEDGRLCFLDFGIVGFLDSDSRRALASFVQAVANRDPDWVVQAAAELGLLAPGTDLNLVRRGVEPILADFATVPLEQLSLAGLFFGIARLGGHGSLSLPPHLAVLVRTLLAAEGTLRRLNPDLHILNALHDVDPSAIKADLTATRHLARLKWETALSAQSIPALTADLLYRMRQYDGLAVNSRAGPSPDGDQIERAGARVALALVSLGLYGAASLLMQNGVGPKVFGDFSLLAAIGYLVALWPTIQLVRSIGRTERI